MDISRLPSKLADVLSKESLSAVAGNHDVDGLISSVTSSFNGSPDPEVINHLMGLENDVRKLARESGIKYHAQSPDDAADFLLEADGADQRELDFTLCGFLCVVLNLHFAGEINEIPELRRTAAKTVEASMMVLDVLDQ